MCDRGCHTIKVLKLVWVLIPSVLLAGCSDADLHEPYGNEQSAILRDFNVVEPSDLQLDELDAYDVSGKSWGDFNSIPQYAGNSEVDDGDTIALISYHSDKDRFEDAFLNGNTQRNGPNGWISLDNSTVWNTISEEENVDEPQALADLSSGKDQADVNQCLLDIYGAYYSSSSAVRNRIADRIGFSRSQSGTNTRNSLYYNKRVTDAYAFPISRYAADALQFEDSMVSKVSGNLADKKNTILLRSDELLTFSQMVNYSDKVSYYVFIAVCWQMSKNCLSGWDDKPDNWAILYNDAASEKATSIYNKLKNESSFTGQFSVTGKDGKLLSVDSTYWYYEPEFQYQQSKPVILVILDAGNQAFKGMKTNSVNNAIAEAIASAF